MAVRHVCVCVWWGENSSTGVCFKIKTRIILKYETLRPIKHFATYLDD